jgi:hypothetical protein
MISLLVSVLMLTTPGLSPATNGHHYGWRNKPPRAPISVEQVVPPSGGGGGQGGSGTEGPSPRHLTD